MGKVTGKLTVYFDSPFWVGVFERMEKGKISAAKITFGVEPREKEIYSFVLSHYDELEFSPAVESVIKEKSKNPKRVQREVKRLLGDRGVGTKSQQALKLQHEQMKVERKALSRREKEAEKQRRFQLKQQKKKEKHRGR